MALGWVGLVATCGLAVAGDGWPKCLPEVPPRVETPGLWTFLVLQKQNTPVVAVRADIREPGRGVIIDDQAAACRKWGGSKRILVVDHEMAKTINAQLAGNSWPVVKGLGAFIADKAAPGAGSLLTIFETAMEAAKAESQVRARIEDEVWRVDFLGRSDEEAVYVVYSVLRDPHRNEAWVLNEQRFEVRTNEEAEDTIREGGASSEDGESEQSADQDDDEEGGD